METPTTPVSAVSSAPNPPPPEVVGVLIPWILMALILMGSFAVHVWLSPIKPEQVEVSTRTTQSLAENLPSEARPYIDEAFKWLGSYDNRIGVAAVAGKQFFIIPALLTLVCACLMHLLIFLTGGTDGGWRVTFRAFALNRIFVEALTLVVLAVVALSRMHPATAMPILFFVLPAIRLIGMGSLFAQLVRDQGINHFRMLFVLGPFFAVSTIISIILTLVNLDWFNKWASWQPG